MERVEYIKQSRKNCRDALVILRPCTKFFSGEVHHCLPGIQRAHADMEKVFVKDIAKV